MCGLSFGKGHQHPLAPWFQLQKMAFSIEGFIVPAHGIGSLQMTLGIFLRETDGNVPILDYYYGQFDRDGEQSDLFQYGQLSYILFY